MTVRPLERDVALRDRLRALYRHKRVLFVTMVLVLAATAAFTATQQKLYTATSQVVLSQQNLAAALTNTEQYTGLTITPNYITQTQADVARSPQLAEQVAGSLKLPETPASFLARSSVSPLANADLLEFSVSDPNPDTARRAAAAYAQQYVAFSQNIAAAAIVKARREVQRALASSSANKALYAQLQAKNQQLATIQALGTSAATVVSTGSAATQTQPRVLRTVLVGFVVALALAIGLASLWEALDTRPRSPDQLETLLGAPLLGTLAAPPSRMYSRGEIVMLTDPGGVAAEGFRILRSQIDLARLGTPCKTIMITSCVAGEGKTTTVANLAVAMAAAGDRVVAVDLDLRGPTLHRFMAPGHSAVSGLTNVALRELALEDVLVEVPVPASPQSSHARLLAGHGEEPPTGPGPRASAHQDAPTELAEPAMLLPAGPPPPNPGEFSNSAALGLLFEELRARFDVVLIDTAPALLVGDALALSQRVDAIVLVARLDVVKRPALTQLRRRLEASPAPTLGVVATASREQSDVYSAYGDTNFA